MVVHNAQRVFAGNKEIYVERKEMYLVYFIITFSHYRIFTLIPLGFQGKTDSGAHIGSTAHMNALPMCLNNVFENGEAHPGTASIAAARRIGAIKTLKNAGQVFFFNTNTIIADL